MGWTDRLKIDSSLHCIAELSCCIGPFLNFVFASCCNCALEVLGRSMYAFDLLESLVLLRWICFWRNGICSAPCCCHWKLLCANGCGLLAAWSSRRSSCCTMPRIRCLVQRRSGLWIAFPSRANQASRLCRFSHKRLVGLTWVSCIPLASTSPPWASVWICK